MKIFIPTRGRLEAQHTWSYLSPEARGITRLVCPPEEVEQHEKRGRKCIARPVSGVHNVRQWIIESSDDPHVVMLDDDLKFFVRAAPDAWSLKKVQGTELDSLLKKIAYPLNQGFAHAGLSPRQMNQKWFPRIYTHVSRMNAVHAVNRDILLKEDIKYNSVNLMEDYHVVLSLFKRGYANKVFVAGAWDQHGLSGSAGGMSLTRNAEFQEAGARKLAELHPEFVDVVLKTPKIGWEGMKERVDVKVAWKKAFASSGAELPDDY